MAIRKRRSVQHIMEDQSVLMLKGALPREWVLHEYKPDYGIDFVLEIFEFLEGDPPVAETLGDLVFLQLKSLANTKIEIERVFGRLNVEKRGLEHNADEVREIEVIKFDLEVPELLTVRAMGVGMPVLLVVASLDLNRLFYVCLNDLIDKVLDPSDPGWVDKGTKRISVPIRNELRLDGDALSPIRFYGKRPKLMAAFSKFRYQRDELHKDQLVLGDEAKVQMALHFISRLRSLDIWSGCEMWIPIERASKEMERIDAFLKDAGKSADERLFYAKSFWDHLVYLSHTHEELCREWHLPTFLSYML